MQRTFHGMTLLAALLTVGCAQFENGSLSPIGPSSVRPVTTTSGSGGASMMGTWTSAGLISSGSSCTNLQWAVTSQTSDSIAGTFSFECVGGIRATGAASGQISGSDVPYTVTGTGAVPGVASCPF